MKATALEIEVSALSASVSAILQSRRFSLEDEIKLHQDLYIELEKAFKGNIFKEFKLDNKNIIDFLLYEGIGLEVKLKGSRSEIFRQCKRYCEFELIQILFLVTNRSMTLPPKINGKQVHVISLSKAWL